MDDVDFKNYFGIKRKSLNQSQYDEKEIQRAPPVKRYIFSVKKELDKYSSGLANHTQVENMLSHIT